ncbi:MAG: universal stress protein [Cyclobacteriaceae bacterium]|nr:universal stress protein [Cyclobacteriaceae bacterium]
MKKIIVPTDFTGTSLFALKSAATLAKKSGGEIVSLHVAHSRNQSDEEIESKFSALKKEDPALNDLPISFKIKHGEAVKAITQEPGDLIVIGSRELHGLKGFFTRTFAEKIAKKAVCPVITLKAYADLSKVRSIVYPTDMRYEQESLIHDVKKLQHFYGANLHLVKVYDDKVIMRSTLEERLRKFAESYQFTDFSVTARANINEGEEIILFAKELGADMIAMATHNRRGLGQLVGGFITGRVIKGGNIPIWTKVLS